MDGEFGPVMYPVATTRIKPRLPGLVVPLHNGLAEGRLGREVVADRRFGGAESIRDVLVAERTVTVRLLTS